MAGPIRVLIVDDSAVVRQALTASSVRRSCDRSHWGAADPLIANDKIRKQRPDVITLDVEMPRMDGLSFLKQIMAQDPIPVVMCSSLTEKGAEVTMKALQYGAVEIINKPRMGAKKFLEDSNVMICDAVKAAARARVRRLSSLVNAPEPKLTADVMLSQPRHAENFRTTEKILAVGASTGGTEALRVFLQSMPYDAPGIVIVQHMPQHFTAAFAKRLNGICRIIGQGSRRRRHGDPRSRTDCTGQYAHDAKAQRNPLSCCGQGRSAGLQTSTLG